MANHKRRRPKHRRSGCLMCKPNKFPPNKHGEKAKARRAWQAYETQGLPSRHEERSGY